MSYTNSPPKYKTTFIPKTTSPFCHKWQRVSHWEIFISSSLEELASSSSSSLVSPSSSSEALREGEGEATKPPRQAYQHAIRPMRVFTWHISSERKSRRASMCWSCAMIASKVTPPTVEVEGAEEEEIAEVVGSTISVRGSFSRT